MNTKKFMILSGLLIGCFDSDAQLKQDLNQSRQSRSAAQKEVSISVSCRAPSGLGYELHVNVNGDKLNNLHDVVMNASYLGHISESNMNKEEDPLEKMRIRSGELVSISACLKKKASEGHSLGVNINIPGIASSKAPEKEPQLLKEAFPLAEQLNAIFAEIEKDISSNQWAAAHKALGKANGIMKAFHTNKSLPIDIKEELTSRFLKIKTNHISDGILHCRAGKKPIGATSRPNNHFGKIFRYLVNISCYEERVSFRNTYLAYLSLVEQFYFEQLHEMYGDFHNARSEQDVKAIWEKITQDADSSNTFEANVNIPDGVDVISVEEYKRDFGKALVQARLGPIIQDFPDHTLEEMYLVMASEITIPPLKDEVSE